MQVFPYLLDLGFPYRKSALPSSPREPYRPRARRKLSGFLQFPQLQIAPAAIRIRPPASQVSAPTERLLFSFLPFFDYRRNCPSSLPPLICRQAPHPPFSLRPRWILLPPSPQSLIDTRVIPTVPESETTTDSIDCPHRRRCRRRRAVTIPPSPSRPRKPTSTKTGPRRAASPPPLPRLYRLSSPRSPSSPSPPATTSTAPPT
ncbi:hypothetical protein VTK73DRAFT_1131 [Phialemonium thermophilum]|uniref:Uncharacterized protein n=1 Tax=Phialemonium thermophilum TaxID=223376 RepID=A0ABR3VTZ3_9PEZI